MNFKRVWFVITILILLGFTITGTFSLMFMRPPDYKFYWRENNEVMRMVEVFMGMFGIFSGGVWLKAK